MPDIFALFLLVLLALIFLGPERLPQGAEALWLALTNMVRAQQGQAALQLEEARRLWERSHSPVFSLIDLLYAATPHLVELRKRTLYSLITLALTTLIGMASAAWVIEKLKEPAGSIRLVFLAPADLIFAYFKVAVLIGVGLAMPFIVYHILAFIYPAFKPNEKRIFWHLVLLFPPLATVLFIFGTAFAYFLMLPFALGYLLTFGGGLAEAQWTIDNYLSFVSTILLWIGFAFEMPLAMFLLARLGLVSARRFAGLWRYAVVTIFIIAAIITPTPDPFNQLLVATPLLVLYGLGILLAKLA